MPVETLHPNVSSQMVYKPHVFGEKGKKIQNSVA